MSIHDKLIDLYQALKYDQGARGLCTGFSLRYLEAALLGRSEQERFEKRLQRIAVTPTKTLVQNIKKVKSKKGKDLTEEDQELLEILSFYDSLFLFQEPYDWAFLINKPFLTQLQFDSLSSLSSSTAILTKGGLTNLYSECFIKTESEIEIYLVELGQLFDEASANRSSDPIGCLLYNENHVVILIYHPSQGWTYRNVNVDYLEDSTTPISHQRLANLIRQGFSYNNSSCYSALNLTAVLPKLDSRCDTLVQNLTQFKQTHVITAEIAQRKTDTVNLINMAAKHGDAKQVQDLINHGASLELTAEHGLTALYIAAQNGHAPVVEILARSHVDLDQTFNGVTPIFVAAQNGHAPVVEILAGHHANINQCWNGVSPLWIATKNNRANVVKVLIEAKAKLEPASQGQSTSPLWVAAYLGYMDIAKLLVEARAPLNQVDEQGATPLLVAAYQGYQAIVALLIDAGADLNKTDNRLISPLYTAAEYGHTSTVKLLIDAGALLNQPNKNGKTPIFIAAESGHDSVIDLLLAAKADYTLPIKKTIAQLTSWVENKEESVQERMALFIEDKRKDSEVLVTPYDIAKIMGHDKIANTIKQYELTNKLSQQAALLTGEQFSFFAYKKTQPLIPPLVNQENKKLKLNYYPGF
ncbi:ankyrin repeat domain-containing protein [Legionella gresilensis]|uniref:ankyrin repeat domain-containing protein n=1 Tax=Legionella gresilensis TaxID=91823 RepID=UPI0010414EB0|nr:ankyrin repeat domain-containing protein [Legionella gresilensis]